MSFIRRSEEMLLEVNENAKGGPGHLIAHKLIESDAELLGKGRLFNDIVLDKNCGVGYHVHEGDAEIYYILSGEAEYNDNGTITRVRAGDVTFTGPGEGHGITNYAEEPMRMIALIIYE